MKKIKNDCLLKLIRILLIGGFTLSTSWATERTTEDTIYVGVGASDFEPKNIGEQVFIPIKIANAPEWESATIEFKIEEPTEENVNINALQIEKFITLDSSKQAPLTVYVPVTVTTEGTFNVNGVLYIKKPNGKIMTSRIIKRPKFSSDLYQIRFGFFSFGGKYMFNDSDYSALVRMARYNLVQKNNELSGLIVKQNEAFSKLLANDTKSFLEIEAKNNLSKEEENTIQLSITQEKTKIKQEYYKKYPPIKRDLYGHPL